MEYLLFELKKVIKNKLALISISILIIISGIVLFMNLHAESEFTLQAGAKKEITYYQAENAKLKKKLLQQKKNSDLYRETKYAIKINEKIASQDYQIQQAAQANKWHRAYTLMWEKKKKEKKYLEAIDSNQINQAQVKELNTKLDFFTYLKLKPLAYERQILLIKV